MFPGSPPGTACRAPVPRVLDPASAALCAAGVEEVVQSLGVPTVSLLRYEPDGAATVLASVNAPGFPVGSRCPVDGFDLAARVFETGRPARIDDDSELEFGDP